MEISRVETGTQASKDKAWDWWAKHDPLWAILTNPAKRGGKWEAGEFFHTGELEVNVALSYLNSLGLSLDKSVPTLDFGCGVGRLTRALSQHFDCVYGVDTSSQMINQAKELNQNLNNINFIHLESDNLDTFQDGNFGFIYSSLVLQHLPPQLMQGYLKEFLRVLKPGGVLLFQLTDHFNPIKHLSLAEKLEESRKRLRLRTRIKGLLGVAGDRVPEIEMYGLGEDRVRGTISSLGGKTFDIKITNSSDKDFDGDLQFLESEPREGWVSKQYCVVKPN